VAPKEKGKHEFLDLFTSTRRKHRQVFHVCLMRKMFVGCTNIYVQK